MNLILFALGFLPSLLQRPLRNFLGAHIEPGAHISFLAFVLTRDLHMKQGARIGPLCLIKVKTLIMGEQASFHPMSLVNCVNGPRARLEIGDFSQIFSFCVLEPSEGIFIGKHVGVGGQGLIFCHGSWPNYLKGGPFSRGPVRIEDEVWLPWRVMILPETTIGAGAVIGAHSLVRGKVPARSLYSGVPAKAIDTQIWRPVTHELQRARWQEIVDDFHRHYGSRFQSMKIVDLKIYNGEGPAIVYSFTRISPDDVRKMGSSTVIDLESLRYRRGDRAGDEFVRFIAGYGIRLGRFA